LSPAVYRRTKTAVYALSLQLSSLDFRQKTLSLTRMLFTSPKTKRPFPLRNGRFKTQLFYSNPTV
ncbi:MAG: hypothetical protein GY943_00560, partial [Chloroflexi bacterium]|nr:hypothetical protein [Chloroflexota bacterium]